MPAPEYKSAPESQTLSFQSILRPIAVDLQNVQERIRRALEPYELPIQDRLDQLIQRPGKMIRPALVLLAGQACGELQTAHTELAAIVELAHAATLLHDDVIDQAAMRRSQPSANALWGNTAAVLLGDLLLSRAFTLCAELQLPGLTAMLTQAAEKICRGELLQNLQRGNWDLSEEEYLHIIDGKTAALIACSAALGARAASADDVTAGCLETYGLRLGQAFQIRDDLLDLLGSEEAYGKTLGTDLATGKPTLPLIVWLRLLPEDLRQSTKNRLSADARPGNLRRQIEESGAADYARKTMQALCEEAIQALEPVPDSPAKASLEQLARYIAHPDSPVRS